MLADNKLIENASWYEGLLSKNFHVLNEINFGFRLDITSVDYGEMESIILLNQKALEAQETLLLLDEFLPLVSKVGDI